ncbi:unnamed protein product [Urochloa humidicola]
MWNRGWTDQPPSSVVPLFLWSSGDFSIRYHWYKTPSPTPGALPTPNSSRPNIPSAHALPPLSPRPLAAPIAGPPRVGRLRLCPPAPEASRSGSPSPSPTVFFFWLMHQVSRFSKLVCL